MEVRQPDWGKSSWGKNPGRVPSVCLSLKIVYYKSANCHVDCLRREMKCLSDVSLIFNISHIICRRVYSHIGRLSFSDFAFFSFSKWGKKPVGKFNRLEKHTKFSSSSFRQQWIKISQCHRLSQEKEHECCVSCVVLHLDMEHVACSTAGTVNDIPSLHTQLSDAMCSVSGKSETMAVKINCW